MIVHVHLQPETARRLSERAAQEGQTLAAFLGNLAEQQAQANGGTPTPEVEETEGRPWRGVFVLNYPQQELFRTEREWTMSQLPSLPPEIVLDPRRLVDEDE